MVSNDLYEDKGTKIQVNPSFVQTWLKPKHVLFGFLWVLFIYQCTQFGAYKGADLATFQPLDILGVTVDSTEDEIKAVCDL